MVTYAAAKTARLLASGAISRANSHQKRVVMANTSMLPRRVSRATIFVKRTPAAAAAAAAAPAVGGAVEEHTDDVERLGRRERDKLRHVVLAQLGEHARVRRERRLVVAIDGAADKRLPQAENERHELTGER